MRSVNKVIIIGNVTRDPQIKTSQNGKMIATFGVATNRNWTTNDGERRNSSEFHECVAWSRLAEVCEKLIRKSTPVYIEGRLKTRTWENEDGTRNHKTEIVITDLVILQKGPRQDNDNAQKFDDTPKAEVAAAGNDHINDEDEDLIVDDGPSSSSDPSDIDIEDDLGL